MYYNINRNYRVTHRFTDSAPGVGFEPTRPVRVIGFLPKYSKPTPYLVSRFFWNL